MIELLLLVSLIAGAILIYRGLRGRPRLSEPTCAKCGYDARTALRNESPKCPECGADLSGLDAVKFGRFPRRPRLIVAGCLLVLLPILIVVPLLMGVRWSSLRPNSMVIAGLERTAGHPWDWRELERRYGSGRLSNEEAAQAVDRLIAYIEAERAKGNGSTHLPWQEGFLAAALRRNAVSNEQLDRLAKAFHPSQLTFPSKARENDRVHFRMRYGAHSNLPGLLIASALKSVTLDGQTNLTARDAEGKVSPEELSDGGVFGMDGFLELQGVPPGEHELTIELDCGLVPESTPPRNRHKPGQPKRWPQTRIRWVHTEKVKLTIVPKDAKTVTLVTDPALDPLKTRQIRLVAVEIVGQGKQVRPSVIVEMNRQPTVPMQFVAKLKAGGREFLLHPSNYDGSDAITTVTYSRDYQDFPAAPLGAVDVVLEPDVASAEASMSQDRLWALPVVFEAVKVERDDRAPATEE